MSGIAGIIGKSASRNDVSGMLDKLKHRGPSGQWIDHGAGYALGVCTSVLGMEKGPGHAFDGQTTLLYDGEIYNEHPAGTPDARLALALYQQHGRTFGAYMEGVFACAIWDRNALVLARDALGVRPLYWGHDTAGTLYFASELKALVGMVESVHELRPGTVFSSEIGLQPYVPQYPRPSVPDSANDAKRALRDVLFRATERRLADRAVGGLLLSGGLDSSIIAAIANEIKPGLRAITVGVEGAPDIENAKHMASHLGMKHEVHLFDTEDIRRRIPEAVYALESFDEDCVSGAIANLVASEHAFNFTNCILSGEGGDELNGGYLMLKDLPDEESRRQCMERLIEIAYNTALQRLDRAMMRNSINYRTPFLDSEVVAFCLQLPVDWKVHEVDDGRFVEKWLLREAFKDMLPEEIYQREKLRFSGGTGTDATMEALSDTLVPEEAFTEDVRQTSGGYQLNSPKELHYYRLFKEHFPEPCFESLVGRWDPQK